MKSFILIIFLITLSSCGNDKGHEQTSTIKFAAAASGTFDQYQGGTLVNVWTTTGAFISQTYLYQNLGELVNSGIDLKSGHDWVIQVFAWKGTNGNLTGDISCAVFTESIPQDVGLIEKTITLNRNKCALLKTPTAITPLVGDGNYKPLYVRACDAGFDPNSTACSVHSPDAYYKIGFVQNSFTKLGKEHLISNCYQMESSSPVNLPIGFFKDGLHAPFPTMLRVYNNSNCTEAGFEKDLVTQHGISFPFTTTGVPTGFHVDTSPAYNFYFFEW